MHYALSTHYAGESLINQFSFFTGDDPNGGFVNYQSKADALSKNLVSVDGVTNQVRLGVDSSNTYATDGAGRPSVRLTSDQNFNHGLFIADFAHMPSSSCGVWPAFWAFNEKDSASYPAGGEVDIIEGANTAERNLISAHTEPGCVLPSTGFTGLVEDADCGPSPDNTGCSYAATAADSTSYGDSFNAEGGGVYAMEWDDEALKIWHFPRSDIPEDIVLAGVMEGTGPEPENWGPPQAVFGGSQCDADTFFYDLSLVININFCGDYAGGIWGKADQCNEKAPTCVDWVAGNPGEFAEAFWDINYIDVYEKRPIIDPGMGNGTFPNTTSSALFPNMTMTSSTPNFPNMTMTSNTPNGPSQTRTITLAPASTTSSAPSPSGSSGVGANPGVVDGYTYLGCFGSKNGFQPWTLIANFPDMDIEACVASCADYKYAGVFDQTCYCAGSLGDAGAVDNGECDFPCPGNALEYCGGLVDDDTFPTPGGGNGTNPLPTGTGSFPVSALPATIVPRAPANLKPRMMHRGAHKRAAPNNILLTVYADLSDDGLPPPAPGMGGNGDGNGNGNGNGNGEGGDTTVTRTVTTALTVTYIDVCPTNPTELIEVEYCTTTTYTVEECGCTADAIAPATQIAVPTVPMATVTETCDACGQAGESTVTLTIPEAVATGGSEVVVTAISVQTLMPISNGTAAPGAAAGNGTMPVMAGAVGTSDVLSWGVAAWLGLVGVFLVL